MILGTERHKPRAIGGRYIGIWSGNVLYRAKQNADCDSGFRILSLSLRKAFRGCRGAMLSASHTRSKQSQTSTRRLLYLLTAAVVQMLKGIALFAYSTHPSSAMISAGNAIASSSIGRSVLSLRYTFLVLDGGRYVGFSETAPSKSSSLPPSRGMRMKLSPTPWIPLKAVLGYNRAFFK
jgi:hypothetical protein